MTPPDFDASQQYPTIVEVHGGPQCQYGAHFVHEFHYLATQGYVVAFSNPRGGQGYGEAHCKAIFGRWGSVDVDDVMTFTDVIAQLPYVDETRMGATGGSYGGLMMAWLIGRTDRFKATVAQRIVFNWTSMYGSCDFNHGSVKLTGAPTPWEDIETNWQQSPFSQIANAVTPTLVIHSINDYRTNLEQGEQLFVALRKLGVPTEMVLFPGESHGLSRAGRTDRRVVRLRHILRWFNKYI